jgi:hypothetical protein
MFTIRRNTNPPLPHGWHVLPVATGLTGHPMSYTGLTMMQGVPVISFYDDDQITPGKQGLYYIEANDARGTSWKAPVQVLGGPLGVHSSIKDVVGEPAIAYFFQGLANLSYIRRTGGVWPAAGNLLDPLNCGSWCSMDFIYDDGAQQWLPAVSYIGDIGTPEFEWSWHGGQVRYVPSVSPPDNLGTSWQMPQVVDSSGPLLYPQFACTSLEYIDYDNNYPLGPPPYTWSPPLATSPLIGIRRPTAEVQHCRGSAGDGTGRGRIPAQDYRYRSCRRRDFKEVPGCLESLCDGCAAGDGRRGWLPGVLCNATLPRCWRWRKPRTRSACLTA